MPRAPGRRSEILDAFVRYVAERGYDRTNLGDIADELGMSKGTIVHHFGTKAQMLQELEETHLTRQIDVLRMVWDRLAAPHERIAAIIYASALLQVIARNSTVASQREVVQLSDDPVMQQVRKLRHQLQTLAIDEIRNGIESGVFRSVDVELAALQLSGSLRIVRAGDSRMTPIPADVGRRIELDELRKRAGCYFDRVAAGQTIEVIRGGKLVARIVSSAGHAARRSA
jgi:AcrR family transcriptional regulator